ncbi:transcriptional regulator [Dissulfurispira thermophila]|uniref:Transcriptional regulator n=2 Tax=root TaxID=1 RepID=A0A7G1H6F3_9BACT|nr:metalloregulator ArsR/SmtB family transcription factor [Dissulfurispira thermophila]BCB97327.1 transcriptional regulator [Dissulfurispira thermophila]
MKKEKSIYELQAEICKILSSPKRIEIISALKDGEKTVTELVDILETPKANVSQHLAVMRLKGILKSRRDGVNIYYSIANPKVVQACALMRDVLNELLIERSRMADLVRKG